MTKEALISRDKVVADIDPALMEKVLISGDLSGLNAQQRMSYYSAVCRSLGLNPLTKPFDYLNLSGNKLVLYAKRDATDQLRARNGISIDKPEIDSQGDFIIVTVVAKDAQGRTDSDVGVVKKTDMQGNFGNALMKAVTKAKRRVTLAICGLGWLDESEVEDIPDARPTTVDAEVVEAPRSPIEDLGDDLKAPIRSAFNELKLTPAQQDVLVKEYLGHTGAELVTAGNRLLDKLRAMYAERKGKTYKPSDENARKAPAGPPRQAPSSPEPVPSGPAQSGVAPSRGDSEQLSTAGMPTSSEIF